MHDSPRTTKYLQSHADCERNPLTLSPEGKNKLISHITAHQYTIRAYVHPFFILHAEREHTDPNFDPNLTGVMPAGWAGYYRHKRIAHPSIDVVEAAFRNAVHVHSDPDQPPLFVFEEGHRIAALIQEFRDAKLLPYIIPTMESNPTPLVRYPDSRAPTPWGTLRERLLDLGVRNIQLGGMLTGQCVDEAQAQLQRAFYVETLLPVHPPKNTLTVDHFGL